MNQEELWDLKYSLVKKYLDFYGNLQISYNFRTKNGIDYDKDGYSLGHWLNDQRKLYKKGELLEHRKKLLQDIGVVLTMDMKRDCWYKKYELLKAYYEHYKNTEVLFRFKTINGYDYDENGVSLGNWVHEQRKNRNILPSSRIELLKKLDFRFDITNNEYLWWVDYELAKKYYEHYGNLDIPTEYRTKNGVDYDSDGKNLKRWLINQVNLYKKGVLSKDKYTLLKNIGLDFHSTVSERIWEEMYSLAKKYYEHYGNLEVKALFITKDGIHYDADGKKLGSWIRNQRRFYDTGVLTSKRKEKLSEIGMRFGESLIESEWKKIYDLVNKYYIKFGNLNIDKNFKTLDGVNYDEDGRCLRSWIDYQKKMYTLNKLSEDKVLMLSNIGVKFDNVSLEKKFDIKWNDMYKLAYEYYKKYNNLEIKRSFRTFDGINYDEKGKKLGVWISSQRYLCYDGRLPDDRINKLNYIGMIWNVRTNVDEVIELCKKYNIDYELNKDILLHISSQELYVKLRFLEDNGFEITNNGRMHMFFTMSNIHMKEIFGLSLEELMSKYIDNDKIKRLSK